MALPLMRKATAVWLVDNTMLSFTQIAEFCGLHELEVNGIADGEVAVGVKGFDPIANNQLTQEEITRCEGDKAARLHLKHNPAADEEERRKGPRYTPISKRQDRPSAIAWLVRHHPELADSQIAKLVGTTKPTIQSIRDRTHWNISNIQPVDPVALGMCKQTELAAAVTKAQAKRAKETGVQAEEGQTLMSPDESLSAEAAPAIPSSIAGLENFTFTEQADAEPSAGSAKEQAESLFNLPAEDDSEDEKAD